jgi:hypothetical protein
MKKTILTTIAILGLLTSVKAQQHLPSKVSMTLTDKQIMRIDSAINLAQGSMDSKSQTNWFSASFVPFYNEVRKQLITDTLKKKK